MGGLKQIAADEADVLINLGGHTRGSDPVTLIFARRPAPVQLMHEGYAGTMGGARHTAHVTDRLYSMKRAGLGVQSLQSRNNRETAEREIGAALHTDAGCCGVQTKRREARAASTRAYAMQCWQV